jgi:hypothetical protein
MAYQHRFYSGEFLFYYAWIAAVFIFYLIPEMGVANEKCLQNQVPPPLTADWLFK